MQENLSPFLYKFVQKLKLYVNFFRKFGIYQGFSFKVEIILLSGNPHDAIMILQGMKIKTSDTLLLLMDLFIG